MQVGGASVQGWGLGSGAEPQFRGGASVQNLLFKHHESFHDFMILTSCGSTYLEWMFFGYKWTTLTVKTLPDLLQPQPHS